MALDTDVVGLGERGNETYLLKQAMAINGYRAGEAATDARSCATCSAVVSHRYRAACARPRSTWRCWTSPALTAWRGGWATRTIRRKPLCTSLLWPLRQMRRRIRRQHSE